jgi:hypothetical protein
MAAAGPRVVRRLDRPTRASCDSVLPFPRETDAALSVVVCMVALGSLSVGESV